MLMLHSVPTVADRILCVLDLLEAPVSTAYETYDDSPYAREPKGAFEGPPYTVYIANLPLYTDERLVASLFEGSEVSAGWSGWIMM
jgi:hypothetical protein